MKIDKKAFMNALTAVGVLLLLVGLIGLFAKYSNGFNEDFKTFYLEHDNKTISAEENKMTFDVGSKQQFDCKYLIAPEENAFYVSISSDITKDNSFDFSVDGNSYSFNDGIDLSKYFNLQKSNSNFTLQIPEDFSIENLLSSLYSDAEEIVIQNDVDYSKYYFRIKVSNYNESVNYYIYFNVAFTYEFTFTSTVYENGEDASNLVKFSKDTVVLSRTSKTASVSFELLNNCKYSNYEVTATINANEKSGFDYKKGINLKNNVFVISLTDDCVFTSTFGFNINVMVGAEYDITFKVDEQVVQSSKIVAGNLVVPPENPVKDGYVFNGWISDDAVMVNFDTYKVSKAVTFTAQFTETKVIFNFTSSLHETTSGGGSTVLSGSALPETNEKYVTFSSDSVTLTRNNSTCTVSFTLVDGYEYYNYEIDTNINSDASPLSENNSPYTLTLSGKVFTITLNENYLLTEHFAYYINVIVTGEGSSSGGGSGDVGEF